MALLKYGKYIEKLNLTVQAIQIHKNLYCLCVNRRALLYKRFACLPWSTVSKTVGSWNEAMMHDHQVRPCMTIKYGHAGPSSTAMQDHQVRPCRTIKYGHAGPSSKVMQDHQVRSCRTAMHDHQSKAMHDHQVKPCMTIK